MQKEAFEKLPTKEQLYFFRCPTCGEMVDNRDIAEIVEHHSHVLHPERFRKSFAGSVQQTGVKAA